LWPTPTPRFASISFFAVQGRQNLIRREHNDELQKYMTGIISGQGQKLIAINNMPDHFHILIGQRPNVALSDLVRNIKAGSSGFINDRRWVAGRFTAVNGNTFYSNPYRRPTIMNTKSPGLTAI
jgi:REP element-mobilizing transposase RayT